VTPRIPRTNCRGRGENCVLLRKSTGSGGGKGNESLARISSPHRKKGDPIRGAHYITCGFRGKKRGNVSQVLLILRKEKGESITCAGRRFLNPISRGGGEGDNRLPRDRKENRLPRFNKIFPAYTVPGWLGSEKKRKSLPLSTRRKEK